MTVTHSTIINESQYSSCKSSSRPTTLQYYYEETIPLGVSSVSYLVEVNVPVHFVGGSTEQWPALSPEGCWDTLLTLLFDLGGHTQVMDTEHGSCDQCLVLLSQSS